MLYVHFITGRSSTQGGEMLVKSEKSSKPDGFVIYSKTLQSALLLPDNSAGRVLKAAARLFLTGEAPEGLELSEEIVLSLFTGDIDSALTHHAEVCARNQRIAANRRAPSSLVKGFRKAAQ